MARKKTNSEHPNSKMQRNKVAKEKVCGFNNMISLSNYDERETFHWCYLGVSAKDQLLGSLSSIITIHL